MFSNIGGKIKTLAKVICWIGIVLSVVFGIIMIAASDNSLSSSERDSMITSGLATIIIGSVISWIGSFTLYGFGELIERVVRIDEKLHEDTGRQVMPRKDESRPWAAQSQNVQSETSILMNETVPEKEIPRPIKIEPEGDEEKKPVSKEKSNSKWSQIDPEWLIEGSTWLKCPKCGEKRPRDFIWAMKKCPACGQSAMRES